MELNWINRYDIKKGTTIQDIEEEIKRRTRKKIQPYATFGPGAEWINREDKYLISCEIGDDITLNIGFQNDLDEWDDYDDVFVMDELLGHPHHLFYVKIDSDNADVLPMHIRNLVNAYNKTMDSFEFLERM